MKHKIFNFDKVQFICFSFVVYAVGVISKNLVKMLWIFSQMFPCKIFIVLALTFRSLIHLELIFKYAVRQGSNVTLVSKKLTSSLCMVYWNAFLSPSKGYINGTLSRNQLTVDTCVDLFLNFQLYFTEIYVYP